MNDIEILYLAQKKFIAKLKKQVAKLEEKLKAITCLECEKNLLECEC